MSRRRARSPAETQQAVVQHAAFSQQVRDALNHLYDVSHLQTHSLIRHLPPTTIAKSAGQILQQQLLASIEALRPLDTVTRARLALRHHALLDLRHVEGLEIPEVCRRLGISRSEYYREYGAVLAAVVSVLRSQWDLDPLRGGVELIRADPAEADDPKPGVSPLLSPLPAPVTSFVGRTRELVEARRLLGETRLLTLVGPPGSGKSRLALRVAAEVHASFADGVCFVPLAAITDAALVASAVAQELGVRDLGRLPLVSTLRGFLQTRVMLLVLDNFEQVISAGSLVAELLAACPGLRVLVTSRAPLRLYGEQELTVPPLALPERASWQSAECLLGCDAIRLFVDRARAVQFDFDLTSDNGEVVAEICRRLDGLPLAIELAATWVRILPPRSLLSRLDSRLQFLTEGTRDAPNRQRTLRSAIAWSHDLLTDAEKRLFRRLGVFVGGFTLEAAAAVGGAHEDRGEELLGGIASLVDKSLLRVEESIGGGPRFGMLETIREFALETLGESGEAEPARRAHGLNFLGVAEAGEAGTYASESRAWLDDMEREHDNLRAALRWSDEQPDTTFGLRLGAAMHGFWRLRGYLSEGRHWLERALARDSRSPSSDHVHLRARADALGALGVLSRNQGDYAAARSSFQKCLVANEALVDQRGTAQALTNLGLVAYFEQDFATARELLTRALALWREIGDLRGSAWSLRGLGSVHYQEGKPALARELLVEAVALSREVGSPYLIAFALMFVGMVETRLGDLSAASAAFRESLEILDHLQDRWATTWLLEGWVGLEVAWDRLERAVRLAGASAVLRETIGAPASPADQARLDPELEAARRRLGELRYSAAWREGRGMALKQAVSYALFRGDEAER